MLAEKALERALELSGVASVIDLGAGEGLHSERFMQAGKRVVAVDLGCSHYYRRGILPAYHADQKSAIQVMKMHWFQAVQWFEAFCHESRSRFDLVWASHILEHATDVQSALGKMRSLLAPGGTLAVTVPPMKREVVGGHLSLWTPGHLIYHLVLAGFDCSQAAVAVYGYNISAFVREDQQVPGDDLAGLAMDAGDVDRLAAYFPWDIQEGFDGFAVPSEVNW